MKIAVTGKGGAGKTTVAAILARAFARREFHVVALDADPNPNLALALGLDAHAAARVEGAVSAILRERAAHRDAHAKGCEPPATASGEDLLVALGVSGPDRVVFVESGRIERPADGCLCCGSHATTRRLFTEIDATERIVIADLEAGVNDLVWAHPQAEDVVVVVTDATRKSLEVARRAIAVAEQLGVRRRIVVANRVLEPGEAQQVRTALPGLHVTVVPEDPAIRRADRDGTSALDAAAGSPAVQAVVGLAAVLLGSDEQAGRAAVASGASVDPVV